MAASLGLPTLAHAQSSGLTHGEVALDACNQLAEFPNDPDKQTAGVLLTDIKAQAAITACRSAVQAHPDDGKMLFQLGRAYLAAKDDTKAISAFEQATDKGNVPAQILMASAYYFGMHGVAVDYKKSFALLQSDEVQENLNAQYILGRMYLLGRAVPKDEKTALAWFKKSAEQGDQRSYLNLGIMVWNGEGTAANRQQGLAYVQKAVDLGNESAIDIAKRMSAQLAQSNNATTSTAATNTTNNTTNNTAGATAASTASNASAQSSSAATSAPADPTTEFSGAIMDVLNTIAGSGFLGMIIILLVLIALIGYFVPFRLWITAWASGAYVGLLTLVAMRLRRVPPHSIVKARISAVKAGLSIPLDELESHFLAGGNVVDVVNAIISADKANIELTFNRAAAIDLAGRNVLDAVQMSVLPKVIQTPRNAAVAQDGIQLIGVARVTVRTNLDRLVGGAGEETIIARVGEGMVSAIGSAANHKDVLERPDSISKKILANGLDSGTAYEILSIDIADIDVGRNIGAALQIEQANADKQIAQAKAEERRAMAVALEQEMRAKVVESEAQVPQAMADAFRAGRIYGTPA